MQSATFDSIVSDLYKAASGSLPWEQALNRMREAFSARMAFLHTADVRDGRIISIRYAGPPSNGSVFEYVRSYHRVDPRRTLVLGGLPESAGTWWHCHEHFDDRFVEGDAFYRDFLLSYNARYTSMVTLSPGGPADPVMTAFALELPAARGLLTEDEREVLRRLGEHMLDALRVYQRVRALMSQALAGHHLVQHFSYPMWLLDEERLISFANCEASREAEAATSVAVRNGRLLLTRRRCDDRLT